MPSIFIYNAINGRISFFKGWIIFLSVCVCVCVRVCLCLKTFSWSIICCQNLSRYPYLDYLSKTAVSMEIQISLQDNFFISFQYIPRSGIAGSCCISILNFLRMLLTIFQSDCTNSLHSCWPCTRVPFSPHACQHQLSSFFISAIPTGIRLYLIVVLTSVSGMITEVEHPFMYLLSFVCLLWKNVYSVSLSTYC